MTEPNTPVRRTARTIKPSLRAKESEIVTKLASAGLVNNVMSDEELSDDDFEANSDVEKPAILHDNEIVPGEHIFKFQSRKHKSNLAKKVSEACSQKTPFVVRKMTKNRIRKVLEEGSSGSEYEVSSEESTSDDSTEETESSGNESEEKLKRIQQKPKCRNRAGTLQTSNKRNRAKYVINSDEYFENCSSNKITTSNNTLEKLETPRLPQYELQKILSKLKLTDEHQKCVERLNHSNFNSFKKWLFILNENFNILLYGLGSKKEILKKFHEYLQDMPVIVVNGFFPTLTVKNILDSIITDLLEIKECPGNINEACDLIIQEFANADSHLYLIIHNIEGEMLRSSKSQNILAQLASVKNIHLIASIDHINGPLIWDQKKLSKFNYIWWDVTSFLPYVEETSFERSMMVQQSGTLALSSLRNVFLSLTTNSKSIYIIIAKHQIENAKNQFYQGISFKDLYMACREAFIVSSDLALRAQLTEFLDHKMIKQKRSFDGAEYLNIPLPTILLQKFVDENS